MERYPFKKHKIKRNCSKSFSSYQKYKPYLENDFKRHCCYCNMYSDLVTESFHIDHFIPKSIFKGKKDYLLADYNNLMLACPKCNLLKGDLYKGDVDNNDLIENDFFYNPETIDYNRIFYRNYIGEICSDDEKGKEMIVRLKLYRPVHNMAWLLEEYEGLLMNLEERISKEKDQEKKVSLEKAAGIISRETIKLNHKFRYEYMGKRIRSLDEEN